MPSNNASGGARDNYRHKGIHAENALNPLGAVYDTAQTENVSRSTFDARNLSANRAVFSARAARRGALQSYGKEHQHVHASLA